MFTCPICTTATFQSANRQSFRRHLTLRHGRDLSWDQGASGGVKNQVFELDPDKLRLRVEMLKRNQSHVRRKKLADQDSTIEFRAAIDDAPPISEGPMSATMVTPGCSDDAPPISEGPSPAAQVSTLMHCQRLLISPLPDISSAADFDAEMMFDQSDFDTILDVLLPEYTAEYGVDDLVTIDVQPIDGGGVDYGTTTAGFSDDEYTCASDRETDESELSAYMPGDGLSVHTISSASESDCDVGPD